MSEIQPGYDGIMAVITNQEVTDVLMIQELTRSERTGKDIGDYGFPAESRDPHEHNPYDTASRIFREEIQITGARLRSLLCFLDVNDLKVGVMHYEASLAGPVAVGTATHEVANPKWFSLNEMRQGSIKVRQGVREVINLLGSSGNRQEGIIRTQPRFPSDPN